MTRDEAVEALEQGGQVLQELAFCDADRLPPGYDWHALGTALIQWAGQQRRQRALLIEAAPADLLE